MMTHGLLRIPVPSLNYLTSGTARLVLKSSVPARDSISAVSVDERRFAGSASSRGGVRYCTSQCARPIPCERRSFEDVSAVDSRGRKSSSRS
jgi:hypothetical protein